MFIFFAWNFVPSEIQVSRDEKIFSLSRVCLILCSKEKFIYLSGMRLETVTANLVH